MAVRHVVLAEGFLPATAKLLRVADDTVDAQVVAQGTPSEIRRLASDLNVGYALAAEKAAASADVPADEDPTQ